MTRVVLYIDGEAVEVELEGEWNLQDPMTYEAAMVQLVDEKLAELNRLTDKVVEGGPEEEGWSWRWSFGYEMTIHTSGRRVGLPGSETAS